MARVRRASCAGMDRHQKAASRSGLASQMTSQPALQKKVVVGIAMLTIGSWVVAVAEKKSRSCTLVRVRPMKAKKGDQCEPDGAGVAGDRLDALDGGLVIEIGRLRRRGGRFLGHAPLAFGLR